MLYWTLPVILLSVVFGRIDFSELLRTLRATAPWLVAVGLLCSLAVMVLGGARWRASLALCSRVAPPWRFALKHYWIGMAIGYFAPASAGWDAYRVVVGGRHVRGYATAAAAVVIEKVVALVAALAIVALLYPLAARFVTHDRGPLDTAYAVALAGLVALVALALFAATAGRHGLVRRGGQRLAHRARQIAARVTPVHTNPGDHDGLAPAWEADRRASRLGALLSVLLLSAGVQVLAGVGNHLFFLAAGWHVALVVNLFLTPLFFFIFLLPISFGSIGIREGAFVFFYGLFGVPAETALVVSVINWSGILLNQAVGGSLIWLCRPDLAQPAAPQPPAAVLPQPTESTGPTALSAKGKVTGEDRKTGPTDAPSYGPCCGIGVSVGDGPSCASRPGRGLAGAVSHEDGTTAE